MSDEWRWFLDTDVQVVGFCISTLIVAFRILSKAIKDGDDELHHRINQVRDEYVRRVEFDAHFDLLREDVRELREDLKGTNKRLDQLMSVLAQDKK
ncbi:hypothetical protein [Ochrobactrum sp. AN78]|uniref:hypothetical protein n=1 Tax=Ochrobactrum sp. AN78 TaxID=3039853 RepID=UPI002989D5B5|nr:hypothetical protein [Ochrobactrum sp. AN78]MDH7790743.1 hypothetical protein [Ochrobactrum sp. AN78]